MYLVSVIIPYYKKKLFIKECIKTVLNQSYKRIEIIIVYDDENLDDLKIIQKIQKIDKRIRYIVNKKNSGAGISRNNGIRLARGKYIAFIDADDLWRIDKIKIQLNFMLNNKCKVSHTNFLVKTNSKIQIKKRIAKDYNKTSELIKSCDIGLSTVMIEKSVFGNGIYFPKIKTKEDFVLWLKILKQRIKICAIKKDLTIWRNAKNSLSSSLIQKLSDGFKVYHIYMGYNIIKSSYYLLILSINYLIKNVK